MSVQPPEPALHDTQMHWNPICRCWRQALANFAVFLFFSLARDCVIWLPSAYKSETRSRNSRTAVEHKLCKLFPTKKRAHAPTPHTVGEMEPTEFMSSQLDLPSLRFNLGPLLATFFLLLLFRLSSAAFTKNQSIWLPIKQTNFKCLKRVRRFNFSLLLLLFSCHSFDFAGVQRFGPAQSFPVLIIVCAARHETVKQVGPPRQAPPTVKRNDLFPIVQFVCLLASN